MSLPLAGPPHCPYQRCHDPEWLDVHGQAGTPQRARSGQLWLLLTIIYGPLWLKTWELEIERLVRSQGTTLRHKTEAAAAVRSRTPAKLCRPSAHPDKHELSFCFSFLSPLYFPSSLSLPLPHCVLSPFSIFARTSRSSHFALYFFFSNSAPRRPECPTQFRGALVCNDCLRWKRNKYLSAPADQVSPPVSFSSPEITTLILTIAMCSWFEQLSAPLFMLSSLLDRTHEE